MAPKKKARKKSTKSKKTPGTKARRTKLAKSTKKLAKKKSAPRNAAKKKSLPKPASIKNTAAKKTSAKKQRRKRSNEPNAVPYSSEEARESQSGDLQGLSRVEAADSESVDELLEEGNAFEADAVSGVEEADSSDEREVHTHEVPEDDVPDEYLEEK
jgi:hypothetical protein